MDDEQFERHKEFMLQQQAQSAARVAQMEELIVLIKQGTRDRSEGEHDKRDEAEG